MFLTKKDVDRHCQEVLNKCKNEKDRNLRCLNIAQQYYNVGDYESAKRYVISFLSVKDDSPVAHKLFAQCLEKFEEKEKALSEYKYSLSLDPKQPELCLKVCELYADSSIVVDKNEAKYWHDKAEILFPYHSAVQKLKNKMFVLGKSQNGMSVESILLDEVKEKPDDPTINAKLLNFYIDNGRFQEAYEHAFKKRINFTPNLFWYQSCIQICKSYKNQFPTSLNEEFYGNYLVSIERSLALCVQIVKVGRVSIPEAISLLASFDETLSEATALKNKSEHLILILNHMYGQLCFLKAHILYRKAKWEDNNWQEMAKLISPLLLLSTASRFDIRKAKDEGPLGQILKICILNNVYRIQQAGYLLTILAEQSPKHFMEKIFHFCASNYWKERICEIIYNTSNYKNFSKASFFMKFDEFSNIPYELPKFITDEVDLFLSVTETLYPSSLHHLVWIGMQYLNISSKNSICDLVLPPKFSLKFTGSLQFAPNSSSTYAENLSKIDVESFLFACVYSAKSLFDHQMDKSKPLASYILPADVSRLLCSPEQDLWWDYVNQMINQTILEENYSRARSTIQRGIENIRLVGNRGLSLHLLVLLGRTFVNKAMIESDSVRASNLETRALLYWKAAIPLLEKILHKECSLTSSKSMFEYQENVITPNDASKLINEGKRFIGMVQVKEKNYCDSIFLNESFEEPRASASTSFSQAAQSFHSTDEILLKTILEQTTKITDKLETLFNKQELLSSNQFHLIETISALSKKVDDVLIMPNDYNSNAFSTGKQLDSPHTASQVTNTNVNIKPPPASPVPVQPLIGNTLYSLPGSVQTNFPMLPPLVNPPSGAFLNPYLSQSLRQTPLQNFQFIHDSKEPNSTPNLSNAGCGLFGTSNIPAAFPPQNLPTLSSTIPFRESSDQSTSQAFEQSKIHQNIFSNLIKANEISTATSTSFTFTPPSTKSSAFSFGMPLVTSTDFSSPVSTSPLFNRSHSNQVISSPVLPATSTAPHSFQIPNMVNTSVLLPSVQVPEEDEESDDSATVEYDPMPDFKPIIPLPDEVEVKTGEEEEETLFESRAKLYRFVEKEWKERGIGPLKILKNKANGRVRILMRREIVHKICANHFLLENMDLVAKGDRAWVYCAMDFADEKAHAEKLCVRFRDCEIANEFRRVFDKNKTATANTTVIDESSQGTPVASLLSTPTTTASTSSPLTPVCDAAKKVVIAPSVLNVPSPKEKPIESSKTQFGGFTFNAKPIFTTVSEKKETAIIDEKKKTPFALFSGFSLNALSRPEGESKFFAATDKPAAPSVVKSDEEKSLLFCSVEDPVDFSNLSSKADGKAFTKSKDFKGFAGAGAPVFGAAQTKPADKAFTVSAGSGLNSTPEPTTSSSKDTESAHDENNDGEYVPTAEFTPVIPLPDLVEVKTGEEGLNVLYEEQCKLFRFTENQWKERGVGKMKILHDPKDGTIRLLMRRDQVYKVCCNQRLTPGHELKPMTTTDKAWSWIGKDFSEGELKDEFLCVRFKTPELASAFKEAFDEAKMKLSEAPEPGAALTTANKTLPALSEVFKRDKSMWECKVCYVNNKKDDAACVSCEEPKDATIQPETIKSLTSDASGGLFKFSSNPSAVTSTSTSTLSFGDPAASSVRTAFHFGMPTLGSAANTAQNVASNAPVFSFGNLSSQKFESGGLLFGNSGFSFGDKSVPPFTSPANTVESSTEKSEANCVSVSIFGGTGNNSFAKSTDSPNAMTTFSFKLPKSYGDNSFNVEEKKVTPEEKKFDNSVSRQPSPDDIEFVSETKISEDEKNLATSLMLPPNYFAYKYSNKNCPGCVGCDEEDRKIASNESNKSSVSDKSPKLTDSFTNIKNISVGNLNPVKSDSGFVFGGPSNTASNKSWLSGSSFSFGNIFNRSTAPVSESTPKKEEENDDSDSEKETVAPNETEPYFEPVVPLPGLVETKTGEEDECIEFCERSKLFRFDEDNKEWKERGVGELKVLFHPTLKSYRLLMRREQIHKVVLNQRITSALNLQPMTSSTKSWCWCGMNLPEEQSNPVLEKLAVRFKTEEISRRFEDVVSQCIARLMCEEGGENSIEIADDGSASATEDGEFVLVNVANEEEDVDEEGIQDAMTDEENFEIIFESHVTLKIFEGDSAADYEGVIRLMKGNPDVPEADDLKSYIEFSTHDVPALYTAEINKHSQAFLEVDGVTILDDDPETERKVTIQFPGKKLSEEFYELYERIK